MSLKIILVMPAFLIIANATAAEAADNGGYGGSHILYQDVTIPPAPSPLPIPYPDAIAAGPQGSAHGGGILVGMGDGSVRQGIADGTSNTLMVGERTPGAGKPKAPSGPQNYGHVAPVGPGPVAPGGLAAETKESKLLVPAIQAAREAARSSKNDGKGGIEVENFGSGATQGQAGQAGTGQRSRHTGGVNVLLGDGSVRFNEPPTGSDETITIHGSRTEAPKGGSLGSLTGLRSINQIATPKVEDAAAGGVVRHRTFSIVDRTNLAPGGASGGTDGIVTGAGPGAGPHVKVFDGRGGSAAGATQGAGPHVKVFDAQSGANAAKSAAGARTK